MDEWQARSRELEALASRLAINMGNPTLYDRALTHASIANEAEDDVRDYESLEFLGDAVLGLAAAHYLFETAPDRTPGEYSRMRASLVNRLCLARVARKLQIAPAIRLGKGEERAGGRQRVALLADCLEALIGALYLDRGYETARDFVVRAFRDEFDHALNSNRVWDFKSRLQNYCQEHRLDLPEFTVLRAEGPDHCKEFEVEVVIRGVPVGRGRGASKKEAEQLAAREALEHEGLHFG